MGTVGEDTGTDHGAAEHQGPVLSDLTSLVFSDSAVDFVPSGGPESTDLLGTGDVSLNISSGSQRGGGGGRSQFRGQGQHAEAFVMASVLGRAAGWLEENPSGVLRQLRSGFNQLHRDQRNAEYSWHLDGVWEENLLPLLDDPEGLTESMIVDWRSWIEEDGLLTAHPLVELVNVTMEHGPGFDVIDPFGPRVDAIEQRVRPQLRSRRGEGGRRNRTAVPVPVDDERVSPVQGLRS
ncbi:DUF604 domain-containing protein [Halosolutus halophilus]|uniref:DUF604 domain-containing protein n=1 Tax=Halosolutus halophilus TaxID=1552990 RepID=UPI0022350A94|nr:DUF604 domain-containing protein [Halosolutus halophilus]